MNHTASSDSPTPYASAAALYRAAGWVAPLPVEGKSLPPTGWTGKEGGWPSAADVQAWIDFDGAKNIGLRLPRNVIGIDVDNYDSKPGAANLAAHIEMWGPLPDTWRSTSRTDEVSGIRLYRIPDNPSVQWESLIPGGGIELVRWDHRYAMVWPSVHPKTGRIYRWTRDNLLTISIPRLDELPFLPAQWILGLVKNGMRSDDHKADIASGAAFIKSLPGAADEPCGVMKAELVRALAGLHGGDSRHDAMASAQLELIRLAEMGHPGAMKVLNDFGEMFVGMITDRDNAGKVRDEFVRALDGAAAIVAGQRTWPPARQDPCVVTVTERKPEPVPAASAPPVVDPETGVVQLHPLVQQRMDWIRADRQAKALLLAEDAPLLDYPEAVSLRDFLAVPDEPVTERIGEVLPIGARVVLAAQMKAGKTTLIANLVRALADGEPFLDAYPVTRPEGTVTLLDNEMDARTLRRWLRDIGVDNVDGVNVVSMLGRINGFDIRIPHVFDYWVKTLKELNTTVLIVDCLKPILDTLDLDERSETGKITTPLTRLKTMAGISELILVHHMGHSNERSRGDSALRGWPEAEWQLVRLTEPDEEPDMNAPRYLKAYGRDVNLPEAELSFDPTTRHLTVTSGTRREAKGKSQNTRLYGLLMDAIRAEPGINSTSITAGLKGAKGWGQKGAETKMLADLVHRGILRMATGDHNSKCYFLGENAPGSLAPPPPPEKLWGPSPNPFVGGRTPGGTQGPPVPPDSNLWGNEEPEDD